jgi:hypothetical protein
MSKTIMEEIQQIFDEKRIGRFIVINHIEDILDGNSERLGVTLKSVSKDLSIETINFYELQEKERIYLYQNLENLVNETSVCERIFESMYHYNYYLKQKRTEHLFENKKIRNPVYLEPKEVENVYNQMKKIVLINFQYYLNIDHHEKQYFYRYLNFIYKQNGLKQIRRKKVLEEFYFNRLSEMLKKEEKLQLQNDYNKLKENLNIK